MNLARLQQLPDWPARMTAEVAALYMGIGKSTFLDRYRDSGVQEGGNILWARVQLDAIVARQFAIQQPRAGAREDRDDSWADFR